MNNIIYFTTAQETNDYNDFKNIWDTPINSSNQIFHNKLIRALSITNHVDVISIRPFSKQNCLIKSLSRGEKISSQVHWHYLGIKSNKGLRAVYSTLQAEITCLKLPKNSIIITDTINPYVMSLAITIGKQRNMSVIGVATDSPSNITGTKRSYSMLVYKQAAYLSGYICLTPSLNDLFNTKEKPFMVIEGIVEDYLPKPRTNKYGKYIFYSGTLLEKYGIYSLIEAFLEDNQPNVKLLICGHMQEEKFIDAIRKKPNIKFLGNITNKECLMYEQHSLACINPRPYSEDLDRYSIPSKVIEYLASGKPTISTRTSRLQKLFSEDAIWIKNNTKEDIIEALHILYKLSEQEQAQLASKAQQKIRLFYSLTEVNKKLDNFLIQFRKN